MVFCVPMLQYAPVNPLAVVPYSYSPPGPPTVQVQQVLYTGNTVTLECSVTSSLPITDVCWQRNLGGTITTITSYTNIYKYRGSTPTIPSLTILCVDQNDAGQYTCLASNIVGTRQSLPITLSPPTVQVQQVLYTGNTVTLECSVTSSLPITDVCWQRNLGGTITTITSNTNIYKYRGSTPTTPSLTILCVDQNDAGQYTCLASNIVGTGQSLPITLSPPTVQVQQLSYPVTTGNTVTLECSVTSSLPITDVCWQRNHGGTITTITSTTNTNKYRDSTPTTPSLTFYIDDLNDAGQYTCFASNIVGTGQSLPITLTLHIPRSNITFSQKLGEGQFGEVFRGELMNREVAIKTLKETQEVNAKTSFIKEVDQLTKINDKNIVTFFGVCLETHQYMMVFEYMENGDLLNYLRKHGPKAHVFNPIALVMEILSNKQLLFIAYQTSAGMVCLASQQVVHRDLAARNCLVGKNLIVKVGDFGLSRDVNSKGYYRAGNNAPLPVKWMAPESLLYGIFTVESDVWSFGVLLWEIFTYGIEPWFGLTNEQAIENITNGMILDQPKDCPNALYEIMKGCWRQNPQDRLKMKEVHERIKQLYFLP